LKIYGDLEEMESSRENKQRHLTYKRAIHYGNRSKENKKGVRAGI